MQVGKKSGLIRCSQGVRDLQWSPSSEQRWACTPPAACRAQMIGSHLGQPTHGCFREGGSPLCRDGVLFASIMSLARASCSLTMRVNLDLEKRWPILQQRLTVFLSFVKKGVGLGTVRMRHDVSLPAGSSFSARSFPARTMVDCNFESSWPASKGSALIPTFLNVARPRRQF